MVERGEKVLVALSGGPDSTALLLMLRERGSDVVAAHYDHALQPASAGMASRVAALCAAVGVELINERRTAPLPRGSRQSAARELRYDFLERAMRQAGAHQVALGHTADDVVEGVVLHLLRGSGIAGLRGMPSRRGPFVRPLLDVWRRDVDAYLAARGITAIDDPANRDERYRRVAVRRKLLPALEASVPGVARRLHAIAVRSARLQEEVEREAESATAAGWITTRRVAEMREPVAAEALQQLYARAGGRRPALVRRHLDAMLRLTRGDAGRGGGRGGRGVDLPGGLRFRIVGERAEVVARVTSSMDVEIAVKDCSGCAEPGAAHLRHGLVPRLAFRRPGLRIRPAGGRGTRKLQDVFVDAKVPREERDGWPLVFAGDELAWVPGLAIDRELRATPGERSLHVTVTRILAAGRTPETAMLESPDSPRGESS